MVRVVVALKNDGSIKEILKLKVGQIYSFREVAVERMI